MHSPHRFETRRPRPVPPPVDWALLGRLWQDPTLRDPLLELQDRCGADVLWLLWLWRRLRPAASPDTPLSDRAFEAHWMRTRAHRARVRRVRALRRRVERARDRDRSAPAIQRVQTIWVSALKTLELTAERFYWRALTTPQAEARNRLPSTGPDARSASGARRPGTGSPADTLAQRPGLALTTSQAGAREGRVSRRPGAGKDGADPRPSNARPQERFVRLALLEDAPGLQRRAVAGRLDTDTKAAALARLWARLEAEV